MEKKMQCWYHMNTHKQKATYKKDRMLRRWFLCLVTRMKHKTNTKCCAKINTCYCFEINTGQNQPCTKGKTAYEICRHKIQVQQFFPASEIYEAGTEHPPKCQIYVIYSLRSFVGHADTIHQTLSTHFLSTYYCSWYLCCSTSHCPKVYQ